MYGFKIYIQQEIFETFSLKIKYDDALNNLKVHYAIKDNFEYSSAPNRLHIDVIIFRTVG